MEESTKDSNAELKQGQRAAGIAARKALSGEEAARLSRAICERLLEHPFYKDAEIILSYKPFAGEADVGLFNERAEAEGKTVAYPVCRENGIMVAAVPGGPAGFVRSGYGIDEPGESSSRILSPQDIDLVIVPCAAFDGSSKVRIGMGAGYYDRFLPGCRNATRLAVAFEAQHIKGISSDPWDAVMHGIITEMDCYS